MDKSKIDVWDIPFEQQKVARIKETIEKLSEEDRKTIEKSLVEICEVSGSYYLMNYWFKVVNFGFYSSTESLIGFTAKWVDFMKKREEKLDEIGKEAEAYETAELKEAYGTEEVSLAEDK